MALDRDKSNLPETKEVCPLCVKPIAKTAKGSITAWVFSAARCNCQISRETPAPKAITPVTDHIDPSNPRLAGDLVILSTLGQGQVGTVYKVQSETTKEIFAAKVLHAQYMRDPSALKRFEREIDSAKLCDHRNLVKIFEKGKTVFGTPYFLMEHLDGKNLATILSEQIYIDEPHALNWFLQICDGVGHAHSKGLVHRDLKPSNIIIVKGVGGSEVVKIVDFGIAKISSQDTNITNTGEIFGSPNYMSPEQCQGNSIDSRSDIYSLGCCFFEMVTGSAPFAAENPIKTVLKQINEPHIPIRKASPNLDLSEGLEHLIDRMLVKNPDERYQTISEIQRDVLQIRSGQLPVQIPVKSYLQTLNGDQDNRRMLVVIASGAFVILATTLLAIFFFNDNSSPLLSQDQHKPGTPSSKVVSAWTLDMLPAFRSHNATSWSKYTRLAYDAMLNNDRLEAYKLRVKAIEAGERDNAPVDDLLELYEQAAGIAPNVDLSSYYSLKAAALAKKNNLADRYEKELGYRGMILEYYKKFDEAGRQYLELAHLKRERFGADNGGYESALRSAGHAFYKANMYNEAKATFTELLRNDKCTTEDKVTAYRYFGRLEFMVHNVTKAKEYFKKALDLAVQSFGPESPTVEKITADLQENLHLKIKTPPEPMMEGASPTFVANVRSKKFLETYVIEPVGSK